MSYKLLAIDLDGTLFTSKGWFSKNTKLIIKKAIDEGLMVTIATGRPFYFAKEVARELNINVPIVSNDGTYVSKIHSDKPLFVKRMDSNDVKNICNILMEKHMEFIVLYEDFAVTNKMLGIRDFIKCLRRVTYKGIAIERKNIKIQRNNKIINYINNIHMSPLKIFVYSGKEDYKDVILYVEEKFKEKVKILDSGFGMEIVPRGISKAVGLKILASHLNLKPEEIIAVGDSENDIEMINYAGLGIAMGNAQEHVKNQADYITKTNEQDGVAQVIQEFVL